jgi:hypothetical protein
MGGSWGSHIGAPSDRLDFPQREKNVLSGSACKQVLVLSSKIGLEAGQLARLEIGQGGGETFPLDAVPPLPWG